MSAPSPAHELRVRELESLATLSGITGAVQLGLLAEPDVVRVDLGRRLLFVGDAKETETPGNRRTRSRLASYVREADLVLAKGGTCVIAIAHPVPSSARRWANLLNGILEGAGLPASSVTSCTIDSTITVTAAVARRPCPSAGVCRDPRLSSRVWLDSPTIAAARSGR